jgi:hypothetical protein
MIEMNRIGKMKGITGAPSALYMLADKKVLVLLGARVIPLLHFCCFVTPHTLVHLFCSLYYACVHEIIFLDLALP